MEDMSSLWFLQETIDELKQRLVYTTLELDSFKAEAAAELRKSEEYMMELFQLLQTARRERDEARDNLRKVLHKLTATTVVLPPTKANNSSITESNSLSVDSLPDVADAGDSGNTRFVNQSFVSNCSSISVPEIDRGSLVIESLVQGKTLPQKGRLVQAILEAGPILQTLPVAGPLPRWRNPPPIQPLSIPPLSIVRGCDSEIGSKKPVLNSGGFVPVPLNSQPRVELSCGSAQMMSNSMLDFGDGGSGRLISAGVDAGDYCPAGKRQRFQ